MLLECSHNDGTCTIDSFCLLLKSYREESERTIHQLKDSPRAIKVNLEETLNKVTVQNNLNNQKQTKEKNNSNKKTTRVAGLLIQNLRLISEQ